MLESTEIGWLRFFNLAWWKIWPIRVRYWRYRFENRFGSTQKVPLSPEQMKLREDIELAWENLMLEAVGWIVIDEEAKLMFSDAVGLGVEGE
ncbi:MAG: hypothetical protein V3W14_07300 [Candidatus Neomarinimicrobiota bacterium]